MLTNNRWRLCDRGFAKNLKVTGGAGADEGYVYFFDTPLGWQEHYYLYPLPLKQLALNTNLEQNPVWTK